MRIRMVIVLAVSLLPAACDSRAPTSPALTGRVTRLTTAHSHAAHTPARCRPSPPRQSNTFEMTGVVTNEAGTPLAGASLEIWVDYGNEHGPTASDLTNARGAYKVNFASLLGSNHYPQFDPAGTRQAVAFVTVEASGYEPYARYVLGTHQHLVENIRLHRIQRITAGESAVLTIASDDSVCVIDAWPGRELICTRLRVVAPQDGIMSVEAVPTQPGFELRMLEVWGGGTGAPRGNPTALRVTGGTEYTVAVGVPWGIDASQSFVVKTSM